MTKKIKIKLKGKIEEVSFSGEYHPNHSGLMLIETKEGQQHYVGVSQLVG